MSLAKIYVMCLNRYPIIKRIQLEERAEKDCPGTSVKKPSIDWLLDEHRHFIKKMTSGSILRYRESQTGETYRPVTTTWRCNEGVVDQRSQLQHAVLSYLLVLKIRLLPYSESPICQYAHWSPPFWSMDAKTIPGLFNGFLSGCSTTIRVGESGVPVVVITDSIPFYRRALGAQLDIHLFWPVGTGLQ